MPAKLGKYSLGLVHDRFDARDSRFSTAMQLGLAPLPPSVDQRPTCSPLKDQGSLGSCTAFSISSSLERINILRGRPYVRLSELWLYQQELFLEHQFGNDAGAQIRDGLRIGRKTGVPPAIDWPYDTSKFTTQPPLDSKTISDAYPYREHGFHRIHNLIEMKQALANKLSVVIGIEVFSSFMDDVVAKSGMIPMPSPNETLEGGHAIEVVGYFDDKALVLFKNSWANQDGTWWGDNGFGYLPYSYFDPASGFVMDMWTLVP